MKKVLITTAVLASMVAGGMVLSSFMAPKTNDETVCSQINANDEWTYIGSYYGYDKDGNKTAFTFKIWERKNACNSYYWVYDDGFVKGLIHLEGEEISELYVDPFFEDRHIGSALIGFSLTRIPHPRLWVLEGNEMAIRFYQKHGFIFTGERKFVPGTDKYEALMQYQ